MDIRVVCTAALLSVAAACTPAARHWKLQPGKTGEVLLPPSLRATITVPLCGQKLKLTPAQVLLRRTEILTAEDEGCTAHGRSDKILEEAVQHQAMAPGAIAGMRYGYAMEAGYTDLVPGWRLRVITLLTRSGRFRIGGSAETAASNTLTIRTDSDFLGHETAYYLISRRTREPGVSIRLESVQAAVGGTTESVTQPKVRLFDLPAWARHVRLVFLTRASNADHDMAVLAARTYWDLEQATAPVQVIPRTGCTTTQSVYCGWVPAGIAVTPEVPVVLNGSVTWVALPATVGSLVPDRNAAGVSVAREWRGKMLPVLAPNTDVRRLPLFGGEQITVAGP